jgi:hypothetical protein
VRLTGADGVLLRKHFNLQGEAIGSWLVSNVLGMNFGTSMACYNLEAQHAIVALALNRAGGKQPRPVTDNDVSKWFDEMFEGMSAERVERDAVKRVLWTVVAAAYRAGWVMQEPFDIEAKLPDLYQVFFGLEETSAKPAETSESEQPRSPSAAVLAAE